MNQTGPVFPIPSSWWVHMAESYIKCSSMLAGWPLCSESIAGICELFQNRRGFELFIYIDFFPLILVLVFGQLELVPLQLVM